MAAVTGPDVDEALGRDDIQILNGHALPDDTLHAAKADAELVLQQLAHAAQAAVARWSMSSMVPKPSMRLRR